MKYLKSQVMKYLKSHDLERAIQLAAQKHTKQVDKAGDPYILHPLRVMFAVKEAKHGIKSQIVAVLHDAIEDTTLTLWEVEKAFGTHVKEALDAITHRPNEPRIDYYERVRANHIAWLVKIADIRDNMSRLHLLADDTPTYLRLCEKYEKALGYLA